MFDIPESYRVPANPSLAALQILAAWPLDDEGCSQYHMRQFAEYVSDHPTDTQTVAQVSRLLAHKTPGEVKGYEFAIVLYDLIGWPRGLAEPAEPKR